MPFSERFRNSEKQDPRITRLESVKRNFERTGYYGNERFIVDLGYFGMLKELLELFPKAHIYHDGTDKSNIPGLVWNSKYTNYFLELKGLDIGSTNNNLLVSITSLHTISDMSSSYSREIAKEIVRKDELNKDILEDIIFRVLAGSGFRVGEHDQEGTFTDEKKHSQDADFDNLYRYHRALKLDPNAFRDLSKEDGDELLRAMFRFAVKKYHPDRGGDNESMRLINEAKEFLDNSKNRVPKQ